MPTLKQQYASELNTIASRYGSLEDETIKRMLAEVKALRSRIAAELAVVTDWDEFRRNETLRRLGGLIDEFERRLGRDVLTSVRDTYQYGGQSIVEPMRAVGMEVAWFTPSTSQLNTLLDFSARLIKKIGDDTRNQIDQQIRLATLGEKSTVQAMRDITQALGVEARAGIWKKRHDPVRGVAARAETDLRTEMQRVFNLSAHAQQLASAERIPGLTKSWMATADTRTRIDHLRAHQKYGANPIPVTQPFIVGGAKLMYPLDPKAPPAQTVNCRCRMATHHPAIGRVGSSLDGRIAQQLKRRAA